MSPRWRWFLPGYVWALLNTLVGLVLALIYRSHSFRFHQGVLVCIGGTFQRNGQTVTRIWGRPGAQTHGWLVIAASEAQWDRKDLRVHEFTHVVQGFIGGPLFMLVYGVFFLAYYLTKQKDEKPGWHDDYRRNPAEKAAYAKGDKGEGWGA